MITKAEAVMAALGVNYTPVNCCVFCHEEKMNFVAAGFNSDGERKGVCSKCAVGVADMFDRRPMLDVVNRIRAGYYD